MDLPEALKRFRQEHSLTQKQVSSRIGINIRLYQKYEAGEVDPAASVITAIADAFNESADYLLGLSDEPRVHVFEESPKATSPNFLDQLIFYTRVDHAECLKQVKGEVDNPAIEYADNLLRHYHRALVSNLIAAGVKL